MTGFGFYHDETPRFIAELADTPAMRRLKSVGMNCGCEYTSFSRFSSIQPYSRFTHSIGTGLITWHFTGDTAASAAALLHDIATPAFAHTVDFLNGDYLLQESTENRTAAIISSSPELLSVLAGYGLSVEDVEDYHRYPIADNDSPKLSADRLEYTLGNAVNYGFADEQTVERLYRDISVGMNEAGENELAFSSFDAAEEFALLALRCARVYVSREDRYSMQILSEVLSEAVSAGVIAYDDLYGEETKIISKLEGSRKTKKIWDGFRSLSHIVPGDEFPDKIRIINAKKRRIDPLVIGEGRVSVLSGRFSTELSDFLAEDFSLPVAAV